MIIERDSNRILVVDPSGNISGIPRRVATAAYDAPEPTPALKSGWRLATAEDVSKAEAIEKVRAAKEAAELAKAEAKARADQKAKDEAKPHAGGPLSK